MSYRKLKVDNNNRLHLSSLILSSIILAMHQIAIQCTLGSLTDNKSLSTFSWSWNKFYQNLLESKIKKLSQNFINKKRQIINCVGNYFCKDWIYIAWLGRGEFRGGRRQTLSWNISSAQDMVFRRQNCF